MWKASQRQGEGSKQQNQLCTGEVLPPYLEESEISFTGSKSSILQSSDVDIDSGEILIDNGHCPAVIDLLQVI